MAAGLLILEARGGFEVKLDRLFGILSMLLERERIPAKELAERFEVSERTIYRDVAALEGAGMPVVTFPGSGGGIGILPGYKLDKRLLSRRDLAAIGAGLAGLSSLGGDRAVKDLVAKLLPGQPGSLFLESDIVIDFSGWDDSDFLLRRIRLLRECIAENRCVEIDYISPSGRGKRWVEPCKIAFKANSWYLYAWCRKRGEFRLFKLSRMTDIGPVGEVFTPRPPEAPLLRWDTNEAGKPNHRVTLRFPREMEYLVADQFGADYRALAGGELEVTFHTTDLTASIHMLLAYGPGVEVVEPPVLKTMLVDWAEKILEKNKT